MGATHFTIYKLNTNFENHEIVHNFNEDKEPDDHFELKENRSNIEFSNIDNYSLYIREGKNKPDWSQPLRNLVTDLQKIENINFSYVLFVEVENHQFVITGGSGYHVIDKYKQYNFGIELLSRLIEPDDNVIKRVNDRFITGNIMGSNSLYIGNVSINTEKDFNNFFEEIYIKLDSNIIESKLGIPIRTKKEDYRFLARDSIKLGKAITLSQLDILLGSVIDLLDEPGFTINSFQTLNINDPVIEELDKILIDKLGKHLNGSDIEGLNIIPFYYVYDAHYMLISNNEKFPYENTGDIAKYFMKYVSLDKEKEALINIIKSIKLIGELEGEVVVEKSLYEHLDIRVQYKGNTYWLLEGNWTLIKPSFIEDLNELFLNRVTNNYNHNFNIDSIKNWSTDISEGKFNFSHNEIDNIYVLDKILYNNIEICDLLVEDREVNKLYFIHVKKGLDGEMRVLSAQIEQAIQLLSNAQLGSINELNGYYDSIINKIGGKNDDGQETDLSISARKFKKRFQTKDEFIKTFRSMDKEFVFAYRPLDSHNFHRPESITSTAAKLSMISLTDITRSFDVPINFLKINS